MLQFEYKFDVESEFEDNSQFFNLNTTSKKEVTLRYPKCSGIWLSLVEEATLAREEQGDYNPFVSHVATQEYVN